MGPQLEGCHREAWRMEGLSRNADWELGRPPTDLELPGAGGAGAAPQGLGGLQVQTPELGRVAATWAAGQATEPSQWALELWKATEEKRAALVTLKQSEETLHQVWGQMWPHWMGPPIGVPPAAPRDAGTPGRPTKGALGVQRRSRCEQAGAGVATGLLVGGARRDSQPPDETPAEGETSRLGRQGWSPREQGAPAESSRRSGEGKRRGGPASPIEPVREVQPAVGAPWLPSPLKQEQHGATSYTGPTDLEQLGGEEPCRPGYVKREEPGDLLQPQAEGPRGLRPIKREEVETGQAEDQEN